MTKAPRAGEVKTRLTPPLTPEEASTLNGCFLRDISAAISEVGADTQGIACYTPVGAEEVFQEIIPRHFKLIPQRAETLSERLISATHDLLAIGFSSLCLINSDSPTVPTSSFAEAARLLSEPGDRVVLGPSDDGGYYLIGLKEQHERIFEGIDWSTNRVLTQTLERADELQLKVHLLPPGYDVDDHATLRRLCLELLLPNELRRDQPAPATEAYLREIMSREGLDRICSNDAGSSQER